MLHESVDNVPGSHRHTQMQLATLPPTSAAAAREHSWCTYHQVQSWLGNDSLQSDWGWYLVNGQLHPVLTRLAPASDALLNIMHATESVAVREDMGAEGQVSCVLW